MSVFDEGIKTPTKSDSHANDSQLPPLGSLSLGSIATPSALAGTNGAETFLVTGNRDGKIKGNDSTRVTENRSHLIGGNQSKQVAGNRTETVAGNHSQTVMGNMNRATIGHTNDTYTGCHCVDHQQEQRVQEPTTFMHVVSNFLEKHGWHAEDYERAWYFAYGVLNVIGANMELRAGHVEAKLGKAESFVLGLAAGVHESGFGCCKEEAQVVHNHINVIQPVVGVAMFHEVAITQKIIIVGVNQVI